MLHQENRGQVKMTAMAHFNSILLHKSGLANKEHGCQSIRGTGVIQLMVVIIGEPLSIRN